MHFDSSDDTKVSLGVRYQEEECVATIENETCATQWLARVGCLSANRDELDWETQSSSGNVVRTKEDDQF